MSALLRYTHIYPPSIAAARLTRFTTNILIDYRYLPDAQQRIYKVAERGNRKYMKCAFRLAATSIVFMGRCIDFQLHFVV